MAKDTLFKNKFSNFFLHQVGAFPIKRDSADIKAVKETLKRLKKGCPVIIFPKGTRLAGREDKKPEPGIGLIALKSAVPVIPAYIQGSDQVLPAHAKRLKRHRVVVKLGIPLKFSPKQSYQDMADQIYQGILNLVEK